MNSSSFEEPQPIAEDETNANSEGSYAKNKKPSLPLSFKLMVIYLAFFGSSIGLYIQLGHLVEHNRIRPAELPFRSSHVGNLTFLVNTAVLAAQISRAEPNKVFSIDPQEGLGDHGEILPLNGRLHVTNTIHTILQFHILNKEFENCACTARLPPRNTILPHEFTLNDIRGTIRLDICELDTLLQRPLDPLQLTWKNRPKCINTIGIIDARVGKEILQFESFPCEAETFRAFEVSCADDMPDCGIHVWSNRNDTWGLFLTQQHAV